LNGQNPEFVISSETELPFGYNDFIHMDEKGFLWLSSSNGISRFDGKNITHINFESDTIVDGSIVMSGFLKFSNSELLFSTNRGFYCLDLLSQILREIVFDIPQNGLINDAYVAGINSEYIYLKSGGVLYEYSVLSNTSKAVSNSSGVRFSFWDSMKSTYIISCPWLNNKGIEIFKKDSCDQWSTFDVKLRDGNGNINYEASQSIVQNDSIVWIVTRNGLFEVNFLQKRTKNYYEIDDAGSILTYGTIVNDSTIYLTDRTKGLWVFNINQRSYSQIDIVDSNGLANQEYQGLRQVYIDSSDNLWATSIKSGKLYYSWLKSNKFNNPFNSTEVGQVVVEYILCDPLGRIWCSTKYHGVFVFNSNGRLIDQKNHVNHIDNNSLSSGLSIDEENNVWVCNSSILEQYNKELNLNYIYDLKDKRVFNIIHLDNDLKIAITNEGIRRLEISEGVILSDVSVIEGGADEITEVFYGSEGLHYLPYKGNKLLVADVDSDFTIIDTIDVGGFVVGVVENRSDKVAWIITRSNLLKYSLQENKLDQIEFSKASLEDYELLSLSKYENNLWITSSSGLINYDISTNEIVTYRSEDGLPSDEFISYASSVDSTGNLWFGTVDGLVVFDPRDITPYGIGPLCYTGSISVNGDQIDDSNIVLSHDKNTLSISLECVNYYIPENTVVHYRFRNFSDQWFKTSPELPINISLSPGLYYLDYYGINSNGIKGPTETISLRITPPFWQEAWFIILSLLLFVATLWALLRYRYYRLLSEQKKEYERQSQLEEKLQNERNRIALDMHDDLGGRLTSINVLAHRIRKAQSKYDVTSDLEKVVDYSKELVDNMRGLVWAMNSNYDNLASMVGYMKHLIADLFEDNDIEYSIEISIADPEVIINGRLRRNLLLSLKEICHNVIKHSDSHEVDVKISQERTSICFIIRDYGVGLNISESSFSIGLGSIENRMNSVNGTFAIVNKQPGTEVTFKSPIDL